MAPDQLDIRQDHVVLRRDCSCVPIFDPQDLVGRRAICRLRGADQEIEVLQPPESLVERRLQRHVPPHAYRWCRFPQLPREQRPSELLAISNYRVATNRLCLARARWLDLDEAVDEEVELGSPLELG